MGLDSYRVRETKKPKVEKIDLEKEVLATKAMKELIDSLPREVDPEIEKAVQSILDSREKEKTSETHTDMDVEWIKENETSEGKINLTSNKKDEEASKNILNDELDEILNNLEIDPVVQVATDGNSVSPLEFTEFANSMIEKYETSNYHRMMNHSEISKFINLYSKAYNVDINDANRALNDTINQQVNMVMSNDQIKLQGMKQQQLISQTELLRQEYGENFLAYLPEDILENYSKLYLQSFLVKRADVDRMYMESLDKAYEDKINSASNKVRGFSILKVLMLVTATFLASVAFIGLSFVFN